MIWYEIRARYASHRGPNYRYYLHTDNDTPIKPYICIVEGNDGQMYIERPDKPKQLLNFVDYSFYLENPDLFYSMELL